MDYVQIVGENLRKARKDNGFSQVNVRNRLCIEQSHLSKIENGNLQPNFSTLVQLSKFYKVSLDELFGLC